MRSGAGMGAVSKTLAKNPDEEDQTNGPPGAENGDAPAPAEDVNANTSATPENASQA